MMRSVVFIFSVVFCFIFALASPVPVADGELVELEARKTRVGRGTWFHPGLGNCGKWDNDNSLILAIGKGFYDQNKGSNCGQWVEIVNTQNGKKAYGMTRDSCQSCKEQDIDMSPALFKKLAPLSAGKITVSWHFMSKSWKP
ncbi:expansin family protein [Panaeolus papilionaceus]|nr:expansin family protein [Panaeolus papilionaceus]